MESNFQPVISHYGAEVDVFDRYMVYVDIKLMSEAVTLITG